MWARGKVSGLWRRCASTHPTEYGKIVRLLVREPSRARLNEGIVTHQARVPIDTDLALAQWEQYLKVISDFTQCEVVRIPGGEDLPDGVFVEDVMVSVGSAAVVTNPGNESRKLEVPHALSTLQRVHCGRIHSIVGPGTLDGGDVLIVPPLRTAFVGLSARTNAAGIAQFGEFTRLQGLKTISVPINKVLHLKSALTALPTGQLIGWLDGLDAASTSVLPSVLAMPEEQGAHVVVLDHQTLILSAAAPRSAELLTKMGYNVLTVNISEFEKLDGCVTCLSMRIRK